MLGILLKKILVKYRCYDKLQLTDFDFIYAANNRQLLIELKSNVHTVRILTQYQSRKS